MENKIDVTKLNLYQKMLKISEEVGWVAKNLTISIGAGKYKGVSENDVISAIKPLEVKYGIFSYPTKHEIAESVDMERVVMRNGQSVVVIDKFIRVKTTYRFVNIHDPSEFLEIETLGDGVDPQDKASGKAQTYADKYALLKGYKIPTGDDPDQEGSKEYEKPSKQTAAKPTAHTTPEQPPFMDVFASDEVRVQALNEIAALLGNDQSKVAQWFKHYEINHDTITPSIADKIITRIKEKQNA